MDGENASPVNEQRHLLSSNKSSGDEFIPLADITKKDKKSDEYSLEEDKMGKCYIINNVDWEQPATRKDVQWCTQVFRSMGFDVKLYLNQTKENMRAIRHNEILIDENYKGYNCLLVLVISHGSTKRNISSVDSNVAWNLDVLEQQISEVKSLQGKPKLLFVDACRGKLRNLVQKSKKVLENVPDVANKEIGDEGMTVEDDEEDEDEDLHAPIEVYPKNVGSEFKAMEIDEKKGSIRSTSEQISRTPEDMSTMAAKRDQFIGLSTVENFLALTIQTIGSPYLQFFMSQLGEDCFLKGLQTIHQTARQKVATDPIPKYGYIVADEHNRLHKNLYFSNYIFRERRGSQPLIKGFVSYESKISLLGVSYNILKLCPEAHLDLALEEKEVNETDETKMLPKSFSNFLKDSKEIIVNEPPNVYMEMFISRLECFKKATALLKIRKNDCLVNCSEIGEQLLSIKSCPGFNVKEHSIERHTVTFHKEFPTIQVLLSQENQDMLQSGNVNSINTSKASFKTKLEQWIGDKDGEDNQEAYERYLNYFGHHFVTEFYQGGSITLTLLLSKEDLKNIETIKMYLNKLCSEETVGNLEPVISSDMVIDVDFCGGNTEYHVNKLSDINAEQMREWKKSLHDRPVPLLSKLCIQPINLLVGCWDTEKSAVLKQVSESLLREGKNWGNLDLQIEEETATYTGETKHGKAHGQGTITLKSMIEDYSGSFKEGRKQGYGKGHVKPDVNRYARNLCFYQGEWLEDKPHGNGEGHFNNGDIYIGRWKNGEPEGLGTVYYKDGKEVMVICKKGFIERVAKGEVQDKQVGTSQDDVIVQSSKIMEVFYNFKWVILSVISVLLVLMASAFLSGLLVGEENVTCTEAIVANWEKVSHYHIQSGTLSINISKLKEINSHVCQTNNVYFDFFSIESKTNLQNIIIECKSREIPQDNWILTNFNNTHILKHLYELNIIRLRMCDPEKYNCSDIVNSRDIQCISVQYRPQNCLQALASQWGTLTKHNKFDNMLVVDMRQLPNDTQKLCQMDKNPVALEIFAFSPNAEESLKEYHSCQSYSNHFNPHVLPFGESLTLNSTGFHTLNYVSGSFIFKVSRGDIEACSYPVKGYSSEKGEDIMKVWETEKCKEPTNLKPQPTTTLLNATENPCSLTIPDFPLHDCFLFEEKVPIKATMVLRMANETHQKCKHKLTSSLEIWDTKTVNVRKKISQDRTPTLEDVTFNLPLNATFCLEVYIDYPLCPSSFSLSRNSDDVPKCSRKVNQLLKVINCGKQW